jgi:acetyl esterase/lipase
MAAGYRLDEEIAQALAPYIEELENAPAIPRGDWRALRDRTNEDYGAFVALAPPVPGEVEREDLTLIGDDGVALAARWYTRGAERPGAAVVYAHGGGLIAGDLDHYEPIVAQYVAGSGVPLLSVAYRLAPEGHGTLPVEDVLTAVAWLRRHATRLGVEPARIAVMGDSAGGGLVASAAILARDRGVGLAHQILVYPMLDDRESAVSPAVEPFLTWTPDMNATCWSARRGTATAVPAVCAPARLEDVRGLPPAYLEVGDLDLFRDETLAYAQRLAAAGVPIELHVHPSIPHAHDLIAPPSDIARRTLQDRVRVLQRLGRRNLKGAA